MTKISTDLNPGGNYSAGVGLLVHPKPSSLIWAGLLALVMALSQTPSHADSPSCIPGSGRAEAVGGVQ